MGTRSRFWWVVAVLPLLASCVSAGAIQSSGGWTQGKSWVPGARILIMAIPDATDDDSEVIGHGSGIGAGLRDALVSHGIGVFVSNNRDFLQAAKEAEGLGYDYVLKAVPIDWEDNATEWSGNPDRAGISIELYEITSKQLAATSTYRMTASSNALRSVNPERFVPELADVGLSKIFGWQPQPWDSPGYRNKVLR